jgi:hypothetical protein
VPRALDATDPDGDSLAYSVVVGTFPGGLTLRVNGTWAGTVLDTRTRAVTVRACDPAGACAVQVVTFVGGVLPDTATVGRPDVLNPTHGVGFPGLLVAAFSLAVALAAPRRRLAPGSRA